MSKSALEELREILGEDAYQKVVDSLLDKQDGQLKAVRSAITEFMPGYTDLHIKRKPRLHMSIKKHGEVLDIAQLSKAEKGMLDLVGDIARRLCVLNPSLDNPLLGEGIVMIDDVDVHLHPKWQSGLISQFSQTFPNCQFVITTHSQSIIGDSKHIQTYLLDGAKIEALT